MGQENSEIPEQVYFISRWRGVALILIGVGFVFSGIWMLQLGETTHFSKFATAFIALILIGFFGAATPYFILNVIIPSRLIIGSPGFILKRPLFRKQIYWWKDIDHLWLTNGALQFVAWKYNKEPDIYAKADRAMAKASAFLSASQSFEGYDGVLPWGWSIKPGALLAVMQAAHSLASRSETSDGSPQT